MQNYEKVKKIGEGTYGVVYLARDIKNSTSVALKKMRMMNRREGVSFTGIRELKILQDLHHENVIGVGF